MRLCRQTLVLAGILTALSTAALAQALPPGPGFGMGFAGPFGGRGWEGFDFAGRGGHPVTGAPFSAQAVTTENKPLTDGDTIHRVTTVSVARDSQGRTWMQTTQPGRGANATPVTVIFITDPVAHMAYELHPATLTATSHPLPNFNGGRGGRGTPPAGAHPNPNANPGNRPNAPVKTSLGSSMISGVAVNGTSYTTTIPAGADGNAQPIQIVRQEWFSDQLHLIVSASDSDPRNGTVTFQLQNLVTGDPDPSLFTVPANYTVSTPGRGGRGFRGGGGGN